MKKPNIILILSDDFSYGDAGVYGGGPEAPFDPEELNVAKKVQRGGSYLFTDQYCSRYIFGTRGKGDVNKATNHLGFRCVVDREQWSEKH